MDKFIYERDFDNELKNDNVKIKEAKSIVFNLPNDLNVYEYRIMCIRLAQAIGYNEDSIFDAFGPLDEPFYMAEEDLEIRKHIFDLMHDKKKIDKFIENDDSVYETDENDNEN